MLHMDSYLMKKITPCPFLLVYQRLDVHPNPQIVKLISFLSHIPSDCLNMAPFRAKKQLDQQVTELRYSLGGSPYLLSIWRQLNYVRVLWSQCFFYNFQLSILAKPSGTILQPPSPPFRHHSSPNRSPETIHLKSSEVSWHMAHLRRKDFQRTTPWKTLGYLERKQQEKHDVLICAVKQNWYVFWRLSSANSWVLL